MFWLRQHILPLVESFQDRERSPGAESFRSALSDGAESFYSALSDHRSSIYYDAESSDLNSSDSDSRYADADEEPHPEHMPAVVTEFEEAVTKESMLDDAYESFSYGKLFEDVYGTVVHRPPLLKRQQNRRDSENEKQPQRKWRPLPRIPVLSSDFSQVNLVTCPSSDLPSQSLHEQVTCFMKQEEYGQEINDALENEVQEGEDITSSFFYLEQAADEFAEFIIDEAKHEACRSLVKSSMLGNKRMVELDLNNLSNDGTGKSCSLGHSAIITSGALHPVTLEDRDILDAFNRQFEPYFDSEEEPDSQAFENASEEEVDCMGCADFDEKGLLNRNALLGTFKRFPQPALDNLHYEHSFSDSSQAGESSRNHPAPFLPATSSASELTDKYWRRHSSDTVDTATVQYKRLDSVNKNFLSSDPDISKHPHLSISNGYADSAMASVPDTTEDISCLIEPVVRVPDPLKDAHAHTQAQCLPAACSNRLLEEGLSKLYPVNLPRELLHENRSSMFTSAQENDVALWTELPKPPHRSPYHSNVTSLSLLSEQPKPPFRSPHHSDRIPQSLLEEQPKPPPRSPRHSKVTPPLLFEEQPKPPLRSYHHGIVTTLPSQSEKQPKPPPRSPRHSSIMPPPFLEDQRKPPFHPPHHRSVTPPSLLEGQPKPPPRSPRDSVVMPSLQHQQVQPEGANMLQSYPMEGSVQVRNQALPDSSLCIENHVKAPTRRRRTSLGLKAPKGILPCSIAPRKADVCTFIKQSGKEGASGQGEPQPFGKEFQRGLVHYESDENSSLSSYEDSGTDAETPPRETPQHISFQGLEHHKEAPTSGVLRLPFSLTELSRHVFEDDSPLDVVAFHVVENCDFLNDTCSDSAPYMMKLGPNDDLSAFLVDPGINEHPELQDSDTDSVFEDTAFESFHDCNLDSGQSGCLPSNDNHVKCGEDVEDWQSFGSQSDLTKSVSDVPTRPLRKRACPSLKTKHSPMSSMDVQLQNKIEAELTCSDTASSEEATSMMTPSVPCVSQDTDTSHTQHVEKSQNNMYMEVVMTPQEHGALGAAAHGQTDTLEAHDNKRNAATTLSDSVASSPLATSCSYQEVPRAGAEGDKLPSLENATGDSFFGGRVSVNPDRLCSSESQMCVKEEDDKMVVQTIEEAPIKELEAVFCEAFTEFYEEKPKHGGSARGLPQSLNIQAEPKTSGECQPRTEQSKSSIAEVLGRTEKEVTELCNVKRGIQGHHNSCYLDATLFAMFSCTYVFDDILTREREPDDIEQYEEIQKVLREDIVNILRCDHYVPSKNVMRLRQLLDDLGGVSGLTTEEKDPEEFLNSLFYALHVEPFLALSSEQETHLYQLFVAKNDRLEIPSVQQLFHQSIHESKLKLKQVPKALIIQMPRCGKQFKLYDYIVPSLKLDITDALEDMPRYCYVCGRRATQECWECFQPEVGLECTSYCDSCNKTVHQHKDRADHKQTALSIDAAKEDAQPRRQVMNLFAVVCIETSHYVCFVKCPVKGGEQTWCFFDSMADREGGEDGHNIPKVERFLEAYKWLGQNGLEKLSGLIRPDKCKLLPDKPRRLFCDAYMCMYKDEFVKKYK